MPVRNNPNFMFRGVEIKKIHAQFDNGDSVLITGIRRTGKSELLHASLFRYGALGHRVGEVDAQNIGDLSVFYKKLLEVLIDNTPNQYIERFTDAITGMPDACMKWIRSHVNKVKVAGLEVEMQPTDELRTYWQVLVEQIAKLLTKIPPKDLPVIGLDELPLMLENLIKRDVPTQELLEMLASLRKLRGSGLRMIICGSVSFENVLMMQDISRIVLGGLFQLKLNPFTRSEAKKFLEKKFTESNEKKDSFCAKDVGIDFILDNLPDYIPEVLNIASGHLFMCKTKEECQLHIDNDVMPSIRKTFTYQFQERLNDNYTDEMRNCAEQILDIIVDGPPEGALLDGRAFPKNYFSVLTKLEYDNFIEAAPHGGWRFCLNSIRIWWRNNRGMKS